ncbi:lysylphosphatidylglycerol synthase transmembrane domain-containing protein [Vibrio hannami]|uniref:lysylphosphatidylglycerol synthase transmembrane domain-containing protein n=1 Tax=Vibrio hannami TaxID=2717094 RepID=UPI0030CA225D
MIERFFDLLVVLALAGLVFFSFPSLKVVAVSIVAIIGMLVFITIKISISRRLCKNIRKLNNRYSIRLALLTYKVLLNVNRSLNLSLSIMCVSLGIAAWSLTALTLVYCCFVFDLAVPFASAFSVYPAAMLSGAVSFLPGGIGVTEGAIVYLLNQFDISPSIGGFVALVVRFSTLWLAMLFGLIATSLSGLYILRK